MEDESRPIYDLMSPEINYTDQAIITLIPMKSSSFCSASTDGTSIQKKFISTSQHLVIAAWLSFSWHKIATNILKKIGYRCITRKTSNQDIKR